MQLADQHGPHVDTHGGTHGPWLSVRWDGRAATVAGTDVWEQRTPGQGIFSRWAWDGARLTLSNDRLGMLPVYYWAHERGLVVSTSIAQLLVLGTPRSLDWAALGVLLQVGRFDGDSTPFAAIRALPPGSSSWWAEGRLHLSGGPTIAPGGPAIGRAEAVATYGRLFAQAMEDTAPRSKPIVLPLSGGRDSRHILLELVRIGAPPRVCLTYAPSRDHAEWLSARELARRAGVDHRFIPLPPYTSRLERRKNLMTDFCTDENLHYVTLVDAVAAARDEVGGQPELYDGIAGDVLSAGLFLSPARLERAGRKQWRALAEMMAGDDKRVLLHPDVAANVPPLSSTIERIATELERHEDAANPLSSYLFWNRTRREIALAPLRMLASAIPVQMPYLHPPLFDWLAQLPPSVVEDHSLHTAAIGAMYPDAADVPYAEAFAPKRPSVPSWSMIAGLARDAVRDSLPGAGGRSNPLRLRHTAIVSRFTAGRLRIRHSWTGDHWLRLVRYLRDLGSAIAYDFPLSGDAVAAGGTGGPVGPVALPVAGPVLAARTEPGTDPRAAAPAVMTSSRREGPTGSRSPGHGAGEA